MVYLKTAKGIDLKCSHHTKKKGNYVRGDRYVN